MESRDRLGNAGAVVGVGLGAVVDPALFDLGGDTDHGARRVLEQQKKLIPGTTFAGEKAACSTSAK